MSSRFYLSIGLAVAAVAVGGWKLLLPTANDSSNEVAGAVSSVVGTIASAQFTGAHATLDAQRSATGSYEGAPLSPPLRLVRADANSYCVEYSQGPVLQHLVGPGGSPTPGPCP